MNSKTGSPMRRIKKKIHWIKKIDENLEVFGADKHKYHLAKTCKSREIETIENELGFSLPESYKQYLMHVGNGGVGPNLGLLSFQTSLDIFKEHKIWPISNEGAGHLIALGPFQSHLKETNVLTEELWLDAEDAGGESRPLIKNGTPKTFIMWYEEWLDRTMEYFIYKNVF